MRTAGALLRHELYKALIHNGGLWMIVAALILKAALICLLPEIKDERIKYSQKQFDAMLAAFHGETDEQKEQDIEEIDFYYLDVNARYLEMSGAYQEGRLSQEEWQAYSHEYMDAQTRMNAAAMLYEKKTEFAALRPFDGAPPAYFYEYGWQSVFNYLRLPDPFLLLLALILGLSLICPETSSGMTNVLYTQKNGRLTLFFVKMAGLTVLLCLTGVVSVLLETQLFPQRFDLSESGWPLYSLRLFAHNPISLPLSDALLYTSLFRAVGLVLTGLFTLALGYLLRGSIQASCVALAVIVLPALLPGAGAFLYTGWLSGVDVLSRLAGRAAAGAWGPPLALLLGSDAVLLAAGYRFRVRAGRKR
jgi:hypothetical protein